jgi:hypothetical protein
VGPRADLDTVVIEKDALSLLQIESKFLGFTTCSLVTVVTDLCWSEANVSNKSFSQYILR